MKKKQLGQSSLSVSQLTVGCWSFGGDKDSYWGLQEQSDVNKLVHTALDQGVNFFDTAFGYNDGQSEISLGKALLGRRQEAIICNKIPIQPQAKLADYEKTVSDSLRRLQTDYLDLLMIHWPSKDEELLKSNLAALKSMQDKGLVREIGVSNFATRTMEIARQMGLKLAANEFAYNLMSRGMETEVLPYCSKNGIGVAAYMPLMQGILTGKYDSIAAIPQLRRRTIHFVCKGNPTARHGGPGAETELLELLVGLKQESAKTGISQSHLAIAWLLAKPGVSTVIAGCRDNDQLLDNIKAAQTSLSEDTLAALDRTSQPLAEKLAGQLDLWQLDEDSRVW